MKPLSNKNNEAFTSVALQVLLPIHGRTEMQEISLQGLPPASTSGVFKVHLAVRPERPQKVLRVNRVSREN